MIQEDSVDSVEVEKINLSFQKELSKYKDIRKRYLKYILLKEKKKEKYVNECYFSENLKDLIFLIFDIEFPVQQGFHKDSAKFVKYVLKFKINNENQNTEDKLVYEARSVIDPNDIKKLEVIPVMNLLQEIYEEYSLQEIEKLFITYNRWKKIQED